MQAPTTPATVTLNDGKERVLRFSNAALKTIKNRYNISVIRDGAAKLFQTVDEDQLSALLALGLNHKYEGGQPGITEEEIDELLDAQNAVAACHQVFTALGASILKNAIDLVIRAMAQDKQPQKVELKPEKEIAPTPAPDPTTTVM